MNVALFAIDQGDADNYKRVYPDIADAKVFIVDDPSRMEGYRVHAAHATPRARDHERYEEAWWTMFYNYQHTSRLAPRVI
jgi:hypothetical protein